MVAYAKNDPEPAPRLTPQQYLERERYAETKSEYHGGIVRARAGATVSHNRIVFDAIKDLGAQLPAGGPCQGFPSDLRVRVPVCDKYYYPDLVFICGEPEFQRLERGLPALLNPTLIIEVLSESAMASDRGEKWRCYRTLESLQTYVLISSDRPMVEIFRRLTNGWFYEAFTEMDDVVPLDSIGCELRLASVYARISFPQSDDGLSGDGAGDDEK